MKKGQSLSLNTLIIVVLILIVLVVTIVVFVKFINSGQGDIGDLFHCEKRGGECLDQEACADGKKKLQFKCTDDDDGPLCCEK